ncbi:MAG: insulinase family protein [Cryomorphaceae bacterium]|nr:insulinase family protein [Cryomorphaceae bacterium]
MEKRLMLFLSIFFSMTVHAQSTKIEFTEYTLDNGLHVILHQDNSTPIVAVSVLYHVGSKDEEPGRTGFAHFFEHLMFEGSENIKRGEYMNIVQANGGVLNANTSHDRTYYYQVLPSNQLKLGLWLESERMLHAIIDNKGVETQREVVKEEKRSRVDNQPYASFQEEIFKRAYRKHPYQNVPIGTMEDLNAASLEEFIAFYKKWYVPNNATLSIAGDFDIKEIKGLIQKYFGEIPKGTKQIKRTEIVEPPLDGEVRDTVYDNIQLPGIFMAYRMPPQTDEDAYALGMLTQLLSSGRSSRFYKEIVDKQQLGLQVFAFPYNLEDGGLFVSLALANMGKDIADLEAAINLEIDKVKGELISEREYQRVLNQLENSFVSQNSSMAGIAERLADYHVYYGDANLINTEIERYRKITREDLKRVANKYLTKENRVILYYLPKSGQNQ